MYLNGLAGSKSLPEYFKLAGIFKVSKGFIVDYSSNARPSRNRYGGNCKPAHRLRALHFRSNFHNLICHITIQNGPKSSKLKATYFQSMWLRATAVAMTHNLPLANGVIGTTFTLSLLLPMTLAFLVDPADILFVYLVASKEGSRDPMAHQKFQRLRRQLSVVKQTVCPLYCSILPTSDAL